MHFPFVSPTLAPYSYTEYCWAPTHLRKGERHLASGRSEYGRRYAYTAKWYHGIGWEQELED